LENLVVWKGAKMKTSELNQIKKALEPIAWSDDDYEHIADFEDGDEIDTFLSVGEIRAARAAIGILKRALTAKGE